jgi:hypothetical protein
MRRRDNMDEIIACHASGCGGRRRKCGIQRDRSARAGFPNHPGQVAARPATASLTGRNVSASKDGKLRVVYAGWDDAKVVLPGEVLELRWGT